MMTQTIEQYDSTMDTLAHIRRVNVYLIMVLDELEKRGHAHDASKLKSPEKDAFDRGTVHLRGLTYGSQEYKESFAKHGMKDAIAHHYAANSHHPEHFTNGISGMSLLDLIEMLADWKAATERHADGSMTKSLEINRERFGISEQLASILANTVREMGWEG